MGISKKGKRKIVVGGKTYFWWVYNEYNESRFDGDRLQLVAEDQSHSIIYGLQQEDDKRLAAINLRHSQGSVCIECPKFENEQGIITPAGIRKLVEWCKAGTSSKIEFANHQDIPYPLSEEQKQTLYREILSLISR
ncbi:hypothetical protein [Fluviicola sp.]|uniref:hypothetical protein n=1 Tax=Fluviicola sp. TaxID=1917219 RepID=UPI0031DF356B